MENRKMRGGHDGSAKIRTSQQRLCVLTVGQNISGFTGISDFSQASLARAGGILPYISYILSSSFMAAVWVVDFFPTFVPVLIVI
ncbi:MAG: hypothetical protein LBH60_01835 [Prevotellaceae bacterium]|jgi:hypothetical protein|nr:hypothetical protein [Prevotellaceae bacterium]